MADGLNQQTDFTCVCGHWQSAHRNGGRNTCKGFRCGCYTFRPVTVKNMAEASVGIKLPGCPKCGCVLTGKEVRTSPNGMKMVVRWKHLKGDFCETFEAIRIDEDAAERLRAEARARESWDAWNYEEENDPDFKPLKKTPLPKLERPVLESAKPELVGRAPLTFEEDV